MKKYLSIFILILNINLSAQYDYNVMSYYAADNSLDGQPRVDMVNVLKFYPVFAIQDSIKKVMVSIYYGDDTFIAEADKMNSGKYWQTLLPEFNLGDALQRVEVEMHYAIPDRLLTRFKNFYSELKRDKLQLERAKDNNVNALNNIKLAVEDLSGLKFSYAVNVLNKSFPNLESINNLNTADINDRIQLTIKYRDILDIKEQLSEVSEKFMHFVNDSTKFFYTVELIKQRNDSAASLKRLNSLYKEKQNLVSKYRDSLSQEIFEDIIGEYSDTSFSGPAIRKSDLVISDDFKSAILLYRYYKNNLRYRKALDPAENLGIFRARYVPFPIVRRSGEKYDKVKLIRPGEKNAPVVFEIGLGFGDEVVSGNNTFEPAFSISRLGVAIVLTDKLFTDDADILGLALTYDFNSYASIGIGRNLAQGRSYPYYSFGINRKAFEQLLIGLAGIFK